MEKPFRNPTLWNGVRGVFTPQLTQFNPSPQTCPEACLLCDPRFHQTAAIIGKAVKGGTGVQGKPGLDKEIFFQK